jgi:hypothetical protein
MSEFFQWMSLNASVRPLPLTANKSPFLFDGTTSP